MNSNNNSNSSASANANASASANVRVLLNAKPFYTQSVAMAATVSSQSCINTEGAPLIPSLTMEDESSQSSTSSASSSSSSSRSQNSQNSQSSFRSANGFGIGIDIGISSGSGSGMSSPPKLSRRKRRRSDLNRRGSITLSNKEIKSSPDLWVPDLMNLRGSDNISSNSSSINEDDDDHSCDYRIELTLSSKRRFRNKYDDFLKRFDRISV